MLCLLLFIIFLLIWKRIDTSGDVKLGTANVTLIESQKCKSILEEFVSQPNQVLPIQQLIIIRLQFS